MGFELACIARGFKLLSPTAMGERYTDSDPDNAIALMKLHGSMHWLNCDNGEGIHVDIETLRTTYERRMDQWYDQHTTQPPGPLGYADKFASNDSPIPVLVPPTDDKARFRSALSNEWRHASRMLSKADIVCIAGYSIPITDAFFQQFYALSMASEHLLRKVYVINTDPKITAKVSNLVGEPAKSKVQSIPGTFSDAIKEMHKQLKQQNWLPQAE